MEIQPVPVQRSRMRRGRLGWWPMPFRNPGRLSSRTKAAGMSEARWVVIDSVSRLRTVAKHQRKFRRDNL